MSVDIPKDRFQMESEILTRRARELADMPLDKLRLEYRRATESKTYDTYPDSIRLYCTLPIRNSNRLTWGG